MRFWHVMALGLAVRLPLAFFPGYKGDQAYWELLARNAVTEGWPHVYALSEREPWLGLYPPLYHALLWLVGRFYQAWISPAFQVPTAALDFLIKLVPIVFDLAIGVVIWRVVARAAGRAAALGTTLFFLLNPAILWDSSVWGMFGDPPYTLAVILAVAALAAGRIPLAWASLAVAAMIKPQALAFVPFVAWVTFRGAPPRRWLTGAAALLLTVGVVLLPFAIAGTLGEMTRALSRTVGLFPVRSANAHNIWFFLARGRSWVSDAAPVGGLFSARALGLIGFGLAYAYALWALGTPPFGERIWTIAPYIAGAFFMLATEMHENYLFPAVTMLALASWQSRPARALAIGVTIGALANMALHDPTWRLSAWIPHRTVMALRVANSAILIGIFVLWTIGLAGRAFAIRAVRQADPATSPASG